MDIRLQKEMEGLVNEDDKPGVLEALTEAAATFELRGVDVDTIIDHLSNVVYEVRNNYGD
jgi:hypothetical protein